MKREVNGLPSLAPFLWVGLIWGLIGLFTSLQSENSPFHVMMWTLGLWFLCMLDLAAIAKTIAIVFILVSPQDLANKPAMIVQVIFWATLKFGCLGLLGFLFWSFGKELPNMALLMGLGTLLVVPLLGGFWWSHKELSYA